MRAPIRSESEAFRFVVASVLAIAVAVAVGLLTEAIVGAVVLACALLVAVVVYLRAPNPDRRATLHGAAHEPHRHGPQPDEHHLLVIANQPLAGEALRERILGASGGRVRIDILAPVLTSRVHLGVSDIDRERRHAQERLQRSLEWARQQGIAARGEVGDPSVTSAIEDELRDWGAQEVIVLTGPPARESWQEREALERLRGELDIPVTHIVCDGDGVTGGQRDGELHSDVPHDSAHQQRGQRR